MDDPFERIPSAGYYNQPRMFSKGWQIRHFPPEDGPLIKEEREGRMVSPRRIGQVSIAGIVVTVCSLGAADLAMAGDKKTKEPAGVVNQIGTALRNSAKKIEQAVSVW
jgi:hypothetical protein